MEGLYLKITEDFIPDPKEARFGGKDALISVEKGDIIFDVKKFGDGWLFGKNLNSGKSGKFPDRCSTDLSGTGSKPKSTSNPFGLRKTEPRKSEVKPSDSSESAGNQAKRTITPRPLKTFGIKKPPEIEKPVEKEGSGDSGVITDEPAQSDKPVSSKAIEGNRANEGRPSDGSSALYNTRGRCREEPTPHVKQIPSDKKPKSPVGSIKEAIEQPVTSERVSEEKYDKVAKPPANPSKVHDENVKSRNAERLEAGGSAAVNVQENPLTEQLAKDVNEGIYQVPNVPPPKPPHVLPDSSGCVECKVQHVYATPENDYTPPASPTAAKNDQKTKKKKSDKKQDSKPKKKSEAKRVRDKQGEKIPLETVSRKERASNKEAARTAKRAKSRCSTERYPKMKILFGIGLGLVVGVFCFLILYLLFSPRHVLTGFVVALITGIVISVVLGFLDARRLKCIVLLIFPSICSSGAKLSLWILLTYFLISGPLCNFIDNVRITARTRGCLIKPRNHSTDVSPRTQYFIHNIEQFENLTDELERHLNETVFLDKSNNGGSVLICMRELFKAQNTCSLAFESLYNNCTIFLKRRGHQNRCRELILRGSACRHLSDSFIRTTCGSINSAQLLPLMKMTAILQKKPTPTVKSDSLTDNHTVQFNGDILARIEETKPCYFLETIKVLLLLLILVVLFEAYRYHKHYLVYNEFDNCYLTLHFKSIEDTRRASGANDGLIPLKKSELQNNIQPTSCRLSQAEKQSLLKYLMIFLVYALFALIFLLGDFFFYQAVTSEEPALLDTNPNMTLYGCEAQLKHPDEIHTIIISVLLGLLLLLIILQAYVLRLRRYITARFYRTRERKRVTYLYYKLLEERKAFYKSTIEKINKVSEENDILDRLDSVLVLAHHFPAFRNVMQFLGLSLKRCMVCGTGLHRKYVTCDTEECGVVYCRTCFWDLESNCLGCMSSSKMTSPSWSSTGETTDGKKNEWVGQV